MYTTRMYSCVTDLYLFCLCLVYLKDGNHSHILDLPYASIRICIVSGLVLICFFVCLSRQTGWFHFVVNYIGPNDGDGIRIFYDGVEVASDSTRHPYSLPAGDGRIVVGRFHTGVNDNYGNGQIDELLFFNQALSVKDIKELYNKI